MLTQSLPAESAFRPQLAPAVLTFATLGKFVGHLRESAARYGNAVVPTKADPEQIPEGGYDLDVDGIALAAAARIFDFNPDVIALIDDAQCHRRPVHICRARGGAPVMMAASPQPSGSEATIARDFPAPICPTCATNYNPSRYDICEDRACCSNCAPAHRVPDRLRPPLPEDRLENRRFDHTRTSRMRGR